MARRHQRRSWGKTILTTATLPHGSAFLVCGFGLLLGMRHATDPDHLVALSTIVSKERSIARAALIGSVWGLGHTATIFAVGTLIILCKVRIPTRLGLGMEFCVAVMLVVLGVLNLTGTMQRMRARWQRSRRPAPADASPTPAFDQQPVRGKARLSLLRPLLIGLVHGLAGSAAVALLVLSTIARPGWAVLYLLIFGLGTMAGMALMTSAVAVPLTYGTRRFTRLDAHLATASGVLSCCFGLFLAYELGYVGGLFTHHPHWIPS